MGVRGREKLKVPDGFPHKQVDISMGLVTEREDTREGDEFIV